MERTSTDSYRAAMTFRSITEDKRLRLLLSAGMLLACITGCFDDEDDEPPRRSDDAGVAMCPSDAPTECDGVCVDTSDDPLHCGACGNDCQTDCLRSSCISCPNVDGRWEITGGDCSVAYCVISQNDSCGGTVACFNAMGEQEGSGTVDVFDGSVRFSATAGSCNLDLAGNNANGPCSSLGLEVCSVQARRFSR